jgi:tyrosine-specific transport protein
MKRKLTFIYAVATLAGTIIGVGFFSLPYLASRVGFWTVLIYFLVLGSLVTLVHLIFGELVLKTPDFKRLPGFAKLYLGTVGEKVALFSTILGLVGSVLAYIIVGGEFLTNLLSPALGGGNLLYTVLYFSAGAILIFFGIKAISKIEFWGLILFFVILFFLFLKGIPFISQTNLFSGFRKFSPNIRELFLPYGPILFSLWGAAVIPELEEMLNLDKKMLKKIISLALLIPIVIYLIFIFFVVGVTGYQTTEVALIGLKDYLGSGVVGLSFIFGIITTFTSFIAIGLSLKNILRYDLKFDKTSAWAISCFFPFILFLLGIKNFISVISFIGGVALGIDGILILLMYEKVSQKKYLVYPLIVIFLGGIVYEIIYFVGR